VSVVNELVVKEEIVAVEATWRTFVLVVDPRRVLKRRFWLKSVENVAVEATVRKFVERVDPRRVLMVAVEATWR